VPDLKKIIFNRYNIFKDILPLSFLVRVTKQRLILPCYHIISNTHLKHIVNLYKYKDVSSFKLDLEFFMKNYKPLDLFDLIKLVKGRSQPPSASFFLSFDDGLKEFYNIIAPVLLEKGIPATCFLNSAFIDNKDMFFRYKESILIELINGINRKSTQWKVLKSWFSDNKMSVVSYKKQLLKIKYDRRDMLDELAGVLNFSFRDYLEKEKPYLTGLQINELIKKGFTFGAHSIDHPEYRYLSFEEQVRQTLGSTDEVSSRFKLDYRIFAFPFTDYGVGRQFFEKINQDDAIDFTAGAAGMKRDSIYNNIQRIPMDEYYLDARDRIKIDYIYYMFKSVVNRDKITRR
jgi:peptidoglycan/xylan/chitin deacetylase (PgdA/CDA1 family)